MGWGAVGKFQLLVSRFLEVLVGVCKAISSRYMCDTVWRDKLSHGTGPVTAEFLRFPHTSKAWKHGVLVLVVAGICIVRDWYRVVLRLYLGFPNFD